MKMLLALVLLISVLTPSYSKAAFYDNKRMIEMADHIVIVEVTKVEDIKKKSKFWTYGQKATATVKETLKGDLKGEIEIYGKESFICASCVYAKGKHLLFLSKRGGFLTGVNWHLGIKKIKDDKVTWTAQQNTQTPIADVKAEIKDVLKNQAAASKQK
jgi:hypothetical protein